MKYERQRDAAAAAGNGEDDEQGNLIFYGESSTPAGPPGRRVVGRGAALLPSSSSSSSSSSTSPYVGGGGGAGGGFSLTPTQLFDATQDRMLSRVQALGGLHSIAQALQTDLNDGLPRWECDEKFARRKQFYGENVFPEPQSMSFLQMFWEALQDTTLVILSGLALLSLIMRLTLGKEEERSIGWIEPVAILVAVLIVASVTSMNDWSKERQFRALSKIKEDHKIKVVRAGQQYQVSVFDLVVGDIVVLEHGDQIPGDGLFIEGHNLKSDQSPLTGEADMVPINDENPFLLSGCQIVEGDGRMLVTAVGMNSQWGQVLANLPLETPETPLQTKLDDLAASISKIGFGFAIATLVVLCLSWVIRLAVNGEFSNFDFDRLNELVDFVMVAVTIVAVAVPEGLPLAVTISLAYSMRKMMKDNNLVRHLDACETMGGATNICSDKTGTLTENRMTVVKGWFAGEMYQTVPDRAQLNGLAYNVIAEGIALNSKASVAKNPETQKVEYQGNKTECALLLMCQDLDFDYLACRRAFHNRNAVPQVYSFSSSRKRMSTIVQLPNNSYRLYTKGASEIILARCSHAMASNGMVEPISDALRRYLADSVIQSMAHESFRTLAIAYRDLPGYLTEYENPDNAPEDGMVLVAIVGIKDPLRREVPDAVRRCKEAGITVRMVTGDNLDTAISIARECGILGPDDHAMEGHEFRNLEGDELDRALANLTVLARSTPVDKLKLVNRLHDLGEVVAVTGDGTNDAPALKAADVGLSMGLSGTEVAKEASDIVILDDNFKSIVNAVLWGRSVYENIRKFLQFQLTVNVVALVLTLISALAQRDALPLTAIQLLWVNLIMDTFAALALATEPPNQALLKRKPYGRFDALITSIMYRNIIGQSLFQLIVLLVLQYGGSSLFNLSPGTEGTGVNYDMKLLNTIIFNTFVFLQLFNEINSRKVNDEMNVFENIFKSSMFMIVMCFTVIVQFLMVQFGAYQATSTVPLSAGQWFFCVAVGGLGLPIGFCIRLIKVKALQSKIPEEVAARRARVEEHRSSSRSSHEKDK